MTAKGRLFFWLAGCTFCDRNEKKYFLLLVWVVGVSQRNRAYFIAQRIDLSAKD